MGNETPTADDERPKGKPRTAKASSAEVIFDEEIYLRFNPDVRTAVAAGAFRSGRDHYERYGRAEGRPYQMLDPQARNQVVVTPNPAAEVLRAPLCTVDSVRLSRGGGVFISGWVNDAADPLDSVDLYFAGWSLSFDAAALARVRRGDAETVLKTGLTHRYGFWGFMAARSLLAGGQCSVVVRLQSGGETGVIMQAETSEDAALRDFALAHLAQADYAGRRDFAAAASVAGFIAPQLIGFNRMVSAQAAGGHFVERFAAVAGKRYRGSFIINLRDQVAPMFLQNAMFARQAGVADYEFIYVCHGLEAGERALREARICRHVYGLDLQVVILPGAAGFATAHNLAAGCAASDQLLLLGDDVLPRDDNFIARHNQVLDGARSDLFGGAVYADDGGLRQAGLVFSREVLPAFGPAGASANRLLLVASASRGAGAAGQPVAGPVPAVGSAFISVARASFEALGGFSEDYIGDGYVDADLSLKSRAAGRQVWLHDLTLWQADGARKPPDAARQGGAIIDRWRFTQSWAASIETPLP